MPIPSALAHLAPGDADRADAVEQLAERRAVVRRDRFVPLAAPAAIDRPTPLGHIGPGVPGQPRRRARPFQATGPPGPTLGGRVGLVPGRRRNAYPFSLRAACARRC